MAIWLIDRNMQWSTQSRFELVILHDHWLGRVYYLSIDATSVLWRKKARQASSMSRHGCLWLLSFNFSIGHFATCVGRARILHSSPHKRLLTAQHSTAARQFKVTLDGLYIEKELAQALGWAPGISTDGVSLRLSGWDPHYFAVTQIGTDAGTLSS